MTDSLNFSSYLKVGNGVVQAIQQKCLLLVIIFTENH